MNEPQVTNTFSSPEEAAKAFQQAKAEAYAEVLAIISEVYTDLHISKESTLDNKVGYNRFRAELTQRIGRVNRMSRLNEAQEIYLHRRFWEEVDKKAQQATAERDEQWVEAINAAICEAEEVQAHDPYDDTQKHVIEALRELLNTMEVNSDDTE